MKVKDLLHLMNIDSTLILLPALYQIWQINFQQISGYSDLFVRNGLVHY